MAFKVYTKPDCVYCRKAKGILIGSDHAFEEIDVMPDELKADLQSKGHTTYPAVFAPDGTFIGGYKELAKRLLK